MNYKSKAISALLLLSASGASAQQIDASADLRFRYEYRHGYGTLFHDTLHAASFVTQRTRINLDYISPKLKLRISPQNVRVWGDVATNAKTDQNFQLHEAWAEIAVSKTWAFKAGRQELNYDDARILGNVDWTMQARSHDVALIKFMPSAAHTLHAGAALNATRESNMREAYTVSQQYRYMQFLWYHGQLNRVTWSVLFLNQALPYMEQQKEKYAWNQTFGPRFTYANKGLSADASFYAQTGRIGQNDLLAWNAAANLYYKLPGGWMPGVGIEYLSGTDGNSTSSAIKSFTPWFGTNHKFNGFMDYFFVGNHSNSVGLTDVYAQLAYEQPAFKARLTPHYFATAAGLYRNGIKLNSYLGTEIDLTAGYKLADFVWLNGGYAQMLATTSMEALKGGSRSVCNNWFFLELQVNPKLFSIKTIVGDKAP